MNVRVRLFAILREQAGSEWVDLELADDATVADAIVALAERPQLATAFSALSVRMAVNRDYATSETRLSADDELALIPPLSGGSSNVHVRISGEPISIEPLARIVAHPGAGAIAVFQGVTRDIERLNYEAYAEMAQERIVEIMRTCLARHGLKACATEHRVGNVPLGEPSVIVAVSAAHRDAAFAGAREAIDRIKAEAPIWKRALGTDGGGEWAPGTPAPIRLTHLDGRGKARMVDVSAKGVSSRVARAQARVQMTSGTAGAVAAGDAPKGEVLGTARLAGIQAAKRTSELVPLAHPLELTYIDVAASVDVEGGAVKITSEVHTVGRTGVEMEAMTACAVAALTVYDMVKGLERGVRIEEVVLVEKTGGRSDWRREDADADRGALGQEG